MEFLTTGLIVAAVLLLFIVLFSMAVQLGRIRRSLSDGKKAMEESFQPSYDNRDAPARVVPTYYNTRGGMSKTDVALNNHLHSG